MKSAKVYILILNWNGWRDTIECLESVFKSNYDSFQVIVCDNNSGDNSIQYIKQWAEDSLKLDIPEESRLKQILLPPLKKPVTYTIYEELEVTGIENLKNQDAQMIIIKNRGNYGFAGGNNIGLRYVLARNDYDYIWILNNDTVVEKESLRNMVESMKQDPKIGAIGSKVLYYNEPDIIQTKAGGEFIEYLGYVKQIDWGKKDCGHEERKYRVDYITGASTLVSRKVLQTVGLINEDYFMYAEDIDWCIRIRQNGFKLGYCPNSLIWHKEGSTAGYRSPLAEYYSTRNILIVIQRFYKKSIVSAFLVSLMVKVLNRLLRGQAKNLVYILRAHWDFLCGKSGMLKEKSNLV